MEINSVGVAQSITTKHLFTVGMTVGNIIPSTSEVNIYLDE